MLPLFAKLTLQGQAQVTDSLHDLVLRIPGLCQLEEVGLIFQSEHTQRRLWIWCHFVP